VSVECHSDVIGLNVWTRMVQRLLIGRQTSADMSLSDAISVCISGIKAGTLNFKIHSAVSIRTSNIDSTFVSTVTINIHELDC
jgi:hypothetical protein